MTVQELIKAALRSIGAIATGETPTADELADGLEALNLLIESWANNRQLIHYLTENSHTLTAGTAAYTIGASADITTTKPVKIVSAFTRGTGIDVPIKIIGENRYNRIATKTMTGVPEWLWPNYGNALVTMTLFPVPASALTLYVYSLKSLTVYTSLTTTLSIPEGYERALKFNLAIDLAPEYGKEPSAAVIRNAEQSKAAIKAINASNQVQPVNLSMLVPSTRFNINAG